MHSCTAVVQLVTFEAYWSNKCSPGVAPSNFCSGILTFLSAAFQVCLAQAPKPKHFTLWDGEQQHRKWSRFYVCDHPCKHTDGIRFNREKVTILLVWCFLPSEVWIVWYKNMLLWERWGTFLFVFAANRAQLNCNLKPVSCSPFRPWRQRNQTHIAMYS